MVEGKRIGRNHSGELDWAYNRGLQLKGRAGIADDELAPAMNPEPFAVMVKAGLFMVGNGDTELT